MRDDMLSQTKGNAWITFPRPNPTAVLRLFCFSYAGGGPSAYRFWAQDLPPEIEVCPVQLPGREARVRESAFYSIEPLVQVLVPQILPYLDKPFAFFGHSLGALVCFETARLLRHPYKFQPEYLFVSARQAPQLPFTHDPIYQLPDAEFMDKLREYNGMSEEVLQNSELMQMLLPILRADFAVGETYIYTVDEAFSCPLLAFGGKKDPYISYDGLQAWQSQTTGSFAVHMFPGDHFYLHQMRPQLLQMIAHRLLVR
jgi:medium-chain acyl-[acyl-carrier-protein] hydrolase